MTETAVTIYMYVAVGLIGIGSLMILAAFVFMFWAAGGN